MYNNSDNYTPCAYFLIFKYLHVIIYSFNFGFKAVNNYRGPVLKPAKVDVVSSLKVLAWQWIIKQEIRTS